MKNIFLTSSIQSVARSISKHIKKPARFAYITTASEPKKERPLEWLDDDRAQFIKAGFEVEDYTITGKTASEIKKYLNGFDGILMEGGNSFYLLQQIQLTKSGNVFRDFVKSGKYYIGSSAGSVVAGPDIYSLRRLDVLKDAPEINGYEGLGLVDFVIWPHWGSGKFEDKYLTRMGQSYNLSHKIILLTDNQYVLVDGENYRIVDVKNEN